MNEAAAAIPLELHAPIPETCKPPLIKEMADALDLVAPGYAWAWHDARRAEAQRRYILPGKTNDAAGNWRHRNRKRLRYGFDRCLPIYGYWTETPRVLTFFNRGYVPVVRTTHEDPPIPEIARLWHDAGGLEANGLSPSELDRQERQRPQSLLLPSTETLEPSRTRRPVPRQMVFTRRHALRLALQVHHRPVPLPGTVSGRTGSPVAGRGPHPVELALSAPDSQKRKPHARS